MNLRFKFIGIVPVSSNDSYIPTAFKQKKGEKRRYTGAYFRKSDQLKKYHDIIQQSFDREEFYTQAYLNDVARDIILNNKGLYLWSKISLPEHEYFTKGDYSLAKKDASNYTKPLEDAIYRGIGVDDSRNILVISEKGFNEDYSYYIDVHISEHPIYNRIDVDIR